jgi:hypothetical protein
MDFYVDFDLNWIGICFIHLIVHREYIGLARAGTSSMVFLLNKPQSTAILSIKVHGIIKQVKKQNAKIRSVDPYRSPLDRPLAWCWVST